MLYIYNFRYMTVFKGLKLGYNKNENANVTGSWFVIQHSFIFYIRLEAWTFKLLYISSHLLQSLICL